MMSCAEKCGVMQQKLLSYLIQEYVAQLRTPGLLFRDSSKGDC